MSAGSIPAGAESFPFLRGEKLLTPGYYTDLELHVPASMEGPKRTENAQGRVWLTDHRVGS